MISAARVPSFTIPIAAARASSRFGLSPVSQRKAGVGVGDGGGDRLIHFVRQEAVSSAIVVTRLTRARSARASRSVSSAALALEQRGDRREGQNRERNAGDPQRQIGLIKTCVCLGLVNRSVGGKNGRSHPRVVHAGNGQGPSRGRR